MERKLRSKAGRVIYALHKTVGEPDFGQINGARGPDRFRLRELENVKGEWARIATTLNILKLSGHRWQRPEPLGSPNSSSGFLIHTGYITTSLAPTQPASFHSNSNLSISLIPLYRAAQPLPWGRVHWLYLLHRVNQIAPGIYPVVSICAHLPFSIFLCIVHSWISLVLLVVVEFGSAIKVASMGSCSPSWPCLES